MFDLEEVKVPAWYVEVKTACTEFAPISIINGVTKQIAKSDGV